MSPTSSANRNLHTVPLPCSIRFAMATPLQPAASPSPPCPPPPPPLPHLDTTLTLSLSLPPPSFPYALSPTPLQSRRPRQHGVASSSAFARVRSSPIGDPPPCTECSKPFKSWKALFGHMRCHPERQWRGIKRPPQFQEDDQFTVQEREVAASLLMLGGGAPRPVGVGVGKGNKKRIVLAASSSAKQGSSCSGASSLSPTAAAAASPRCDDHKCSVCARGFATGQALGGHKRCHWESACAERMGVASHSGCRTLATSSEAAAAVITLDLNLPPPRTTPLPWMSDDDGGLNVSLELKLG